MAATADGEAIEGGSLRVENGRAQGAFVLAMMGSDQQDCSNDISLKTMGSEPPDYLCMTM
jgi:hypothetical protein